VTDSFYFYLGALAGAVGIAAVFTGAIVVAVAAFVVGAILIGYGVRTPK
jgi:hypothetical protein